MKPITDGLASVIKEREKQDEKWGIQDHPMPIWWLMLTEEIGEASKLLLDLKNEPIFLHRKELRKELVQIVAVALAMLESYDRKSTDL